MGEASGSKKTKVDQVTPYLKELTAKIDDQVTPYLKELTGKIDAFKDDFKTITNVASFIHPVLHHEDSYLESSPVICNLLG